MKTLKFTIIAVFLACEVFAQTEEKKPTAISETLYILPKSGKNLEFESAVLAHNKKFHPAGPYVALLRRVEYGKMAGWYVWVMQGTFASLDTRPTDAGGHQKDWNLTIDPLVEKYGDTGLWSYNADLSFGNDIMNNSKKYIVWAVDLKRGSYYRFKELSKKLKSAYEAKGDRAFIIYNNGVHVKNGPDVGILWSFNKFAELEDNWGAKDAYEKLYGEGSWQNMIDEWNDIVIDYEEEIRTKL